jgi:hypothetical protein
MIASKVPSTIPDKRDLDNLNFPSSEGILTVHTPTGDDQSIGPSTDLG